MTLYRLMRVCTTTWLVINVKLVLDPTCQKNKNKITLPGSMHFPSGYQYMFHCFFFSTFFPFICGYFIVEIGSVCVFVLLVLRYRRFLIEFNIYSFLKGLKTDQSKLLLKTHSMNRIILHSSHLRLLF